MRGAYIAVRPLCGICVNRDGIVEEVIDGRRTFVCGPCSVSTVADPGVIDERPRKRLITALRFNPGATFDEIRGVLTVPDRSNEKTEYNRYSTALVRLVADGVARKSGEQRCARYWLVGARMSQ